MRTAQSPSYEYQVDGTGLKFSMDDFFALIRAMYNKRAEKSTYKRQTFCQNQGNGFATIRFGGEEWWVEQLVRSHVIENWEAQDEPEHLTTIRDRLLRNEQRAARCLAIYQQILQGVEVPTDDTQEILELLLSGLVVKQQGLLKIL